MDQESELKATSNMFENFEHELLSNTNELENHVTSLADFISGKKFFFKINNNYFLKNIKINTTLEFFLS